MNQITLPNGKIATDGGVSAEAGVRYQAGLPEFSGTHLWTLGGLYRVADPTSETWMLDVENLITVEGPGCLFCGQLYDATIGDECTGEWTD